MKKAVKFQYKEFIKKVQLTKEKLNWEEIINILIKTFKLSSPENIYLKYYDYEFDEICVNNLQDFLIAFDLDEIETLKFYVYDRVLLKDYKYKKPFPTQKKIEYGQLKEILNESFSKNKFENLFKSKFFMDDDFNYLIDMNDVNKILFETLEGCKNIEIFQTVQLVKKPSENAFFFSDCKRINIKNLSEDKDKKDTLEQSGIIKAIKNENNNENNKKSKNEIENMTSQFEKMEKVECDSIGSLGSLMMEKSRFQFNISPILKKEESNVKSDKNKDNLLGDISEIESEYVFDQSMIVLDGDKENSRKIYKKD